MNAVVSRAHTAHRRGYEMKKWLENTQEMETILAGAPVGRLGLADDGEPYVVPLNFVYGGGRIYFHAGLEGRKIDMLKKNPRVCFEVDELKEVVVNKEASCFSTAYYQSVIAWGSARFLESDEEKLKALDLLMQKYAAGAQYEAIAEHTLAIVNVCEIKIDSMTGKANAPDEATE
jgi:nitroimidazol reductase NimA-like FMN-containing flavoprotein (pyridoxamine 5'-phosphate oxidase superfamily)